MMEDYGSDTSRIRDARLQPQDCHPTPLQSHDNVVKSSAEEKLLGEIAFLVEKSSNLASDFTTSLQNNVSSSDNVSESCDCLIGFMSEVAESRTGAGVDDGRVNLDENGKGHFDCVLAAEEKIGPSESVAPCVSKVQESDALRNSSSRCIEEQLSSLRAPSVVKDDKESMLKESFLKIEEKSNSVKSGGGPTAESSIEIKGDSFNDQEGRRDSSKIHGESVAVKGHTQNVDSVVQGSGSEEIYRSDPLRGSLNIQLIDETALIQSPSVSKHGNGGGKEMDCVAHARDFERNGKKLADEDMAGKKEKKSRRRGKGAKKVLEANGKQYLVTHEVEKGGDCSRRLYPRKQMLALRFVNCEGQRRLWNEIYCGLGPVVAKEYDNLTSFGKQKPIHSGFDPRQRFVKKEEVPAIPGGEFSYNVNEVEIIGRNKMENVSTLEARGCGVGEAGFAAVDGEGIEDSDSDEEYSSILRPAFLVDGDPDFDSGPPEDGLEYLRRVRWEAARIPKVKVAKVDRSNLNKDQTVYMPTIPDIAKCPDHLLPSKGWEDAFLADFSELRKALSDFEASYAKDPNELQSSFTFHEFRVLPENTGIENIDEPPAEEADSFIPSDCSPLESPNADCSPTASNNETSLLSRPPVPKSSVSESPISKPTLSAVLGMEPAARVSALRRRIGSVEPMGAVARDDCLWLFALCATVDMPLDADTCASLRCLLRKCASLRAAKSEPDDEVVMLNILVTISGRYFGQLEK